MSTSPTTSRKAPALGALSLASCITSISFVLVLVAVHRLLHGDPATAVLCGILCIGIDTIDGPIARRTGGGTAFGARLDSLADMVAAALLPALWLLSSSDSPLMAIGAGAFALAGAWRLAWFDTQPPRPGYFTGMSTPFAAGILWVYATALIAFPAFVAPDVVHAGLPLVLAALMLGGFDFPKGGPLRLSLGLLLVVSAVIHVLVGLRNAA